MLKYGYMLLFGEGIEQDTEKGIHYIKMSIHKGYNKAINFYNLLMYTEFEYLINKDELEKYLKMAADNDNDVSQLFYSIFLLKKYNNTYENKRKAAIYLKKSSDKGNIISMYLYGCMLYNNGNKKEAAFYFKQSADKEYFFSMHFYGKMLLEGDGIEQNKIEAALYFKEAANYGYTLSMFQYGNMLLKGIGVKPNKTEAYKYIEQSFILTIDPYFDYKLSISNETSTLFHIDNFPKDMIIAYDKSYYKGMFNYGNNLLRNKSKLDDGLTYILRASDYEVDDAIFKMGKLLYRGKLLHQDKLQASNYFVKSANLHNRLALFYFGLMLFFGDGIKINRKNGAYYVFISTFPITFSFLLILLIYLIFKKFIRKKVLKNKNLEIQNIRNFIISHKDLYNEMEKQIKEDDSIENNFFNEFEKIKKNISQEDIFESFLYCNSKPKNYQNELIFDNNYNEK